jgi:site-specific recombinase XerD
LSYACREGLLLDNPASHLETRKQSKSQLVIPTREQFTALVQKVRAMDARAEHGADLIELLAYSGMPLREATALRNTHSFEMAKRIKETPPEPGQANQACPAPCLQREPSRVRMCSRRNRDFN